MEMKNSNTGNPVDITVGTYGDGTHHGEHGAMHRTVESTRWAPDTHVTLTVRDTSMKNKAVEDSQEATSTDTLVIRLPPCALTTALLRTWRVTGT